MLLASTSQDDIVLDPFAGTGTTAAVAKRLRRHFIGIERHPAYAEAAIGRVRRTKPISEEGATSQPTKRDAPRMPFGSLVEQGLIAAGNDAVRPAAAGQCGGRAGRVIECGGHSRLDPQGRRGGAECAELQWLDVLAFRAGRGAAAA